MKEDIYWIGPCPALEDAVQVGVEDYDRLAKEQCRRFIAAIRKVMGPEPEGARLTIKSQPHDFGRYFEVAVVFDGDNLEATRYAADCDNLAPETWEAAELAAPVSCKRYVGMRTPDGCTVTMIDEYGERPLDPRYDLRNHSPDGFNWGYSGSGPSQLALALVADALGDDERAQRVYQDFKLKVVARIDADSFELSADEVLQKVADLEAGRGRRRS